MGNLLDVRNKVIEISGRYELATETRVANDTDNGIDFYINGGIRDLDLELDVAGTASKVEKSMAIGEYKILLRGCRFVKEVRFTDSDGVLSEPIVRVSLTDLKDEYPELGGEDTGTPSYYAEEIIRKGYGERGLRGEIRELIIMPPPDEAITIQVLGGFFTEDLVNINDENWWTINHFNLVVLAAMRNIELFHRNTQGYNDWNAGVQKYLQGLDKDSVEDEMMEDDLIMEG